MVSMRWLAIRRTIPTRVGKTLNYEELTLTIWV